MISRFIPGKTTLLIVCSGALGAGLGVGTLKTLDALESGGSAPVAPVVDDRFVALGKAYLPQLGKVYASAWTQGAGALEAGQPVEKALQSVTAAWDAGRVSLFDRLVTPELVKIVPEGQADSAISPAQRAELARAWRGFAAGLGGASR